MPSWKEIDMDYLLPCCTTVLDTVERKSFETRIYFKEKSLPAMMVVVGGVTYEGLKEKIHDRKRNDFMVH